MPTINVNQTNASETAKGIVEEATQSEVNAGTDIGGTGAKLFIVPSKIQTYLAATYQTISGLFASVMALVLTGFVAGANTAIAATDTLAQALAKIQGQINARPNENATTIAAINHAAAEKSALVDADEIAGQDSASSFSLIRTTWTSIKAFLKTYFDTLYTASTGWVSSSATWSYSSADAPTYVISINEDVTGILSVGMRIRLVQTTTKYFIVTAVGSFSGGATLVTVYGGTDYTLANAAISSPNYSASKIPFGFPVDQTKWQVVVTDSTDATQSSPTAATWYNLGSIQISIPIGAWRVRYRASLQQQNQFFEVLATLSTTASSAGDAIFGGRNYGGTGGSIVVQASGDIVVSSKTTYYLNAKTSSASVTSISFQGTSGQAATKIIADCAYL